MGTFCTIKEAPLLRSIPHYQERWKTGKSLLQTMAKAEVKGSCPFYPFFSLLCWSLEPLMGPMVLNGPVFSPLPCEADGLPSCSVPFTQPFLTCPKTCASQLLLHTTWSFASLAELFSVKIQIGRHFY